MDTKREKYILGNLERVIFCVAYFLHPLHMEVDTLRFKMLEVRSLA